jgi:MFS superfamily sulfate permease-like transporter
MHTLSADPNTVVLAGDILDWATLKTNQIGNLIKLVIGVMVLAAVAIAYWKTKSWVATLVAFLLGALVLWGIANLPSLQSKVGSEIEDQTSNAVPQVLRPDGDHSEALL